MIILAGSIRIPPDKLQAAAPVLEAIVRGTRGEPGCITYSFAHDVVDEGMVRIFEVFVDADALAAHRASAHMATWRAAWPALGIGDRDMSQYDVAKSEKL